MRSCICSCSISHKQFIRAATAQVLSDLERKLMCKLAQHTLASTWRIIQKGLFQV